MMKETTINYLETNVAGSRGTALYLNVMRLMYHSFEKDGLSPVQRIESIWTANFVVRAWRNWLKAKHGNVKQCVSTNAYQCLEFNAGRKVMEMFLMSCLSSQPNEKFFRNLRSMSTTNQTIINFTIKELTDKLKRLHVKQCIMHKYKSKLKFPAISRLEQKPKGLAVLPNDREIEQAVLRAMANADIMLKRIGISNADFRDSINLRSATMKEFEFVGVEEDELVDDYEDSDDEVVSSENEERQTEVRIEKEHDEDEEEMISETDEEVVTQKDGLGEEEDELIYDAVDIFENFEGELKLTNSTAGTKHYFQIRDCRGTVKHIKKMTFLNTITDGRHRLTNDRL